MDVGSKLPIVDGRAATAAVVLMGAIETIIEAVKVSDVVEVPSVPAIVVSSTDTALGPAWTWPSGICEIRFFAATKSWLVRSKEVKRDRSIEEAIIGSWVHFA